MKGNRRQPAAASQQQPATPASPTTKGTAKYTNKDGSKFITVPKVASPADQPQPSPTAASMPSPAPAAVADEAVPQVNRKKAKRRAKAAAKAAAEADLTRTVANGLPSPAASGSHGPKQSMPEPEYSDDDRAHYPSNQAHGNGHAPASTSKAKKKKGKKGDGSAGSSSRYAAGAHGHSGAGNHGPSPLEHSLSRASGISKEKIWNTSSQEERQRIKEFWLGLGEDERKSLVKVEKDAVLKKMKEQQKHTCSCTVCGRKRTAIEEELEGLYDAYYEELESFANQPNHNGEGPPMLGPSRHFGSTGGYTSQVMPSSYPPQQPSRGRIVEHVGDDDDEEGDEEYSEEELDEEDEYSDEEEPEEIHRDHHPTEQHNDFFSFGNSLTVQGGILTVADDLLKNDGKKFIEMMEQLAERRMAREEDAKDQYSGNYPHAVNGGNYPAHSHAPPPEDEEEYEEDEDEEEYDSQEEEYDEEEDTMTEEQRMEEGRRMFQIFAARMFEQRVLTAYREKVARERQEKLLEELAEESREADQRKAKKAKEAQKRKDKLQQKKQALAEEKARKEAERAAEEADRLAEEQRKAEEQRQKAEERRKKKEAQKRAEEEDRLRKEAERQRRQNELKERQAEQERKAREAKEKEKKAKEEAKQKEKAAREQKEREARERKEKQEKEKRDREAEKEANEKQRREERAAAKAATLASAPVPIKLVKRPSQQQPGATLAVLPQNPPPTSVASPQIPVATPVIPKIPTPMRPRQLSQQDPMGTGFPGPALAPHGGLGPAFTAAPNPIPDGAAPVHMSPAPMGQLAKVGSSHGAPSHSLAASPLGASTRLTGIQQQQSPLPQNHLQQQHPPLPLPHSMGFGAPLGLFGGAGPMIPPPGFGGRLGHDSIFPTTLGGDRFRTPGSPGPPVPPGLGMPIPSMNGPPARGGLGSMPPPPGFAQTPELATIGTFGSLPKDSPMGLSSHSRQASAGFDSPAPPMPRPAPIGRPGSVVQGQRGSLSAAGNEDADDIGNAPHLGSSALIDDSDEPLQDFNSFPRRGVAPGPRGFPPVASGVFGMDPTGAFGSPLWNHPAPPHLGGPGVPFGHTAPPPGFGNMAPMPAAMPWGASPGYAPPGLSRPSLSRSVQIRLLLCRACQELSELRSKVSTPDRSGGSKTRTPDPEKDYISLEDIKAQIDAISPSDMVTEAEILDLCDTEGNQSNGGGSFDTRHDVTGQVHVRWVPTGSDHIAQRAVGRSLGEIGSPIIGGGSGGSNSPWGTPVGGR